MNNRISVGGIFCNIQKAINCFNHGIIVDKLELGEISGKFLNFI